MLYSKYTFASLHQTNTNFPLQTKPIFTSDLPSPNENDAIEINIQETDTLESKSGN